MALALTDLRVQVACALSVLVEHIPKADLGGLRVMRKEPMWLEARPGWTQCTGNEGSA